MRMLLVVRGRIVVVPADGGQPRTPDHVPPVPPDAEPVVVPGRQLGPQRLGLLDGLEDRMELLADLEALLGPLRRHAGQR
jgi:hypothetical protein